MEKLLEYESVTTQALQKGIVDEKATWKYIPESDSEYLFEYSSKARKQKLFGVAATNGKAESVWGGATVNSMHFGRISLSGAGAVSNLKRNAFLN